MCYIYADPNSLFPTACHTGLYALDVYTTMHSIDHRYSKVARATLTIINISLNSGQYDLLG